jgi:hypothetical protein
MNTYGADEPLYAGEQPVGGGPEKLGSEDPLPPPLPSVYTGT